MHAVTEPPAKQGRARGRPPLPASDVAKRRATIIEVASRMFFTAGFAHTRLEAIASASGVTKRTIYELIGDKEALFRAACGKLNAEGPSFQFRIPIEGSAAEVLRHMARQLIDHSLDKELLKLERAVIAETTYFPKVVSTVVTEGKAKLVETIGRIFIKLAEQGLMRPVDPVRAAAFFYDATVGARGFRAVFGSPDEHASDEEICERVDMFLYGYVERHGKTAGSV